MKAFVIKQHEKDFANHRELSASELPEVAGGMMPPKGSTVTVTPNGDGGNDGTDAQ